jgi:hypothetical protein
MSSAHFAQPYPESEHSDAGKSDSHTSDKDIEKGTQEQDRFPRTETVRFNEDKEGYITGGRVTSGAGIGMHRTLTLERPRYAQKNKVIGDFKTLSISISEGGLASADHKKRRGQKSSLKGESDSTPCKEGSH